MEKLGPTKLSLSGQVNFVKVKKKWHMEKQKSARARDRVSRKSQQKVAV